MYRPFLAIFVASLVLVVGVANTRPAAAAIQTFTVTKTADTNDGTCNADCSLREAITAANTNPNQFTDRDVIQFNIPGAGVKLIQPTTALPVITAAVEIRGLTQPQAACNSHARTLLIQLDGSLAPGVASGIVLDYTIGSGSIVEGLTITNWGDGITMEDGNAHSVICNNIGVNPAGTVAAGNDVGVRIVDADDAIIGGSSGAAARNIISGNGTGVRLTGVGTDAVIQGNYVGTTAAATAALPNSIGISRLAHFGTVIGGTSAGARNIISGNTLYGVQLLDAGTATIQGNYIGYQLNGTTVLPNGLEAITVLQTGAGNSVVIGGIGAGQGNRIYADTDESAIAVVAGAGQTVERVNIRGNRIRAGLLGINLQPLAEANDAITPNDTLDLDTGPNGLQNFPVLSAAVAGAPGTISGTMPGKLLSTYQLDFFSTSACTATHRDGEVYLGSTTVSTTIVSSTVSFSASISGFGEGSIITATATDSSGNTSEFSGCVTATGQVPSTFVVNTTNDIDDGTCNGTHCSLREAINASNANGNPEVRDFINFNIGGSGIRTISPSAQLPDVTQPVAIDGTTQPGAVCTDVARTILIEIRGNGVMVSALEFLEVPEPGFLVRGLAIGNYTAGRGINVFEGSGHQVECNNIGVTAVGATALPNEFGIVTSSAGITIGGDSPSKRNIVSGNTLYGMVVSNSSAANTVLIQGNYVGTNFGATTAIANSIGIGVDGTVTNLLIGGTEPGTENVVSGNTGIGIAFFSNVGAGNRVLGNVIGYRPDGVTSINSSQIGIQLPSANDGSLNGGLGFGVQVGGVLPGEANAILTSGSNPGVEVLDSALPGTDISDRHVIRGNSISAPSSIGINLRDLPEPASTVTGNDTLDPDVGPNGVQNFPVLTSANGGTPGSISGALNSSASATFIIDFYRGSGTCGQPGTRDGEHYLGSTTVDTNGGGNAAFNAVIAAGFSNNAVVTATATDVLGNTSEFSNCVTAVAPPSTEFVVNTTADDIVGLCDVNHCSLREALTAANNNGNGTVQDVISFNIPGSGVQVINVGSLLPTIGQSVLIDGSTQPGATCEVPGRTILVEVRGPGTNVGIRGFAANYTVGPGSQVKGLAITDFGLDGIGYFGGSGHSVECSNIGVEADGQTARGNGVNGVLIDATSGAAIGSDAATARNIIGANAAAGVELRATATNPIVAFNFIGVAADGVTAIPNARGIFASNVVGPNILANVISANTAEGIFFGGKVNTGRIRGNDIGYAADGTTLVPNGEHGIEIQAVSTVSNGNSIGGKNPGEENRIYAEDFPAVEVRIQAGGEAINTRLLANSIKTLNSLGFALSLDAEAANEVTPNDDQDADEGPNLLQNYPDLTSAITSPGTIAGTLNSTPQSELEIQFFAGSACGPERDGERFLGGGLLNTDAFGNETFSIGSLNAFAVGEGITAIVTDFNGNSSEFSGCILATAPPAKTVTGASLFELVSGSPDTPLSVFGTDFEDGDEVTWNGNTVPTTFVSPTQLDIVATTDLLTFTMNSVDIGVVNASGVVEFEVTRSSSDVDCDDTADAIDALFALRVLAGLETESPNCPADANQSGGAVDLADILHIRSEMTALLAPLKSLFQLPP